MRRAGLKASGACAVAGGVLCLISSGGGGCAKTVDFTSLSQLGEGIRGKLWRTASFLEANLASPDVDAATKISALSYDLAVSGDDVWLAATFYDSSSSLYRAWVRRYVDEAGWVDLGSDFGKVDSSPTLNKGLIAVADGPGDIPVLVAFDSTTGAETITSVRSAGSWSTTLSPSSSSTLSLSGSSYGSFLPGASVAFDGLGKGWIGFVDLVGSDPEVDKWESSSGIVDEDDLSTADGAGRHASGAYDGSRWVCFAYEDTEGSSGRSVQANCIDSTTGTVSTSAEFLLSLSTGSETQGVDFATNGADTFMSVFYQRVSGRWRILANLISGGDVSSVSYEATPSYIDGAVTADWETVPAVSGTGYDAAKPQVVHVGGNRFMAAWVGVNLTSRMTTVFYNTYDPVSGGWGVAAEVPNMPLPFTIRPAYEGIDLFSNGAENVGLAAVYREIEGGAADGTSDTRRIRVLRYHTLGGWQLYSSYGNGCTPGSSAKLLGCTHRPVGAILPSGNTVVIFQDQDSSGNFRVAGVEFN